MKKKLIHNQETIFLEYTTSFSIQLLEFPNYSQIIHSRECEVENYCELQNSNKTKRLEISYNKFSSCAIASD